MADVRALYEAVKAGGMGMKFELAEAGSVLVLQCLGPDGIPVDVQAPSARDGPGPGGT